jgi:tetratricopeptide (TPR) repeat protein
MSEADKKIIDLETGKVDVETVRFNFSLPTELYEQLKSHSDVDPGLMAAIVEQSLISFLDKTDEIEASGCQNQHIYTCEDYEKLIKTNPNDYKAWYGYGVVLRNLGRYEEAIASLDKALEIKPDYHKAWYARGNALYSLDFYEEAIASYNKAIELKPDYAEAHYYQSRASRRVVSISGFRRRASEINCL